jgi:hypothetical protein
MIEQLKKLICDAWSIREDAEGTWTITSPFLFDDGDAFPVFLNKIDGGWVLRDHGMACSHLFFDDFTPTEARLGRIAQLAQSASSKVDANFEITTRLGESPDAFQIADFLKLLAQVQGVAIASSVDREQSRYVTQVRQSIEAQLSVPDFDENWSPPQLAERLKAKYRADLRLGTQSGGSVVLFLASTSDKANVSSLSTHRFHQVDQNLKSFLAYHPEKVASEAVFRFQDEVGDDSATVPVVPGDYARLFRVIRDRGVLLAGAS